MYIKTFYSILFQNTQNHVNRILLHCNDFTEMQDIVTLIAHSPESTANVKFTVNLIQNFVKQNIKKKISFQNIIDHLNRIYCTAMVSLSSKIWSNLLFKYPTRIAKTTQCEFNQILNILEPNIKIPKLFKLIKSCR